MTAGAQRERIEMRVNADIKVLAERASAAAGFATLTDFLVQLIRENAPKILNDETSIYASNEQFDRFVSACQDTSRKPSKRMMEAAQRLDAEGF